MEGGAFGLSNWQRTYLYLSLVFPTAIVVLSRNLAEGFACCLCYYCACVLVYIWGLSIEKSLLTLLFNELGRVRRQLSKGLSLGLSAYLLITIYGMVALRIGRVIVPKEVALGLEPGGWAALAAAMLANPPAEECFWRLFLPKVPLSTQVLQL